MALKKAILGRSGSNNVLSVVRECINEFIELTRKDPCTACEPSRPLSLKNGDCQFATCCVIDAKGYPTNENYVVKDARILKKTATFSITNTAEKPERLCSPLLVSFRIDMKKSES
jgi:hypothetical protein